MADLKTFIEQLDETVDELPRHERPYFLLQVLRLGQDRIRASIKDLPTGTEKENALRVVQKYDEAIAEFEHLIPPPDDSTH